MAGPHDPEQRRRAWISAALAAVALLFVPFLMWLVLPAPPKITPPQMIAAAADPAPPPPSKPRPRPSTPAPRPAETSTTADEAGPVHGRVLSPDGAPMARVMVTCTDRESMTVTDNDGHFEMPAPSLGCSAVARKPGFGSSDPVTLKAGDARVNTLQLRKGGRIEGVVVDEGGAPVTRFSIAVEKFIGAEGDDDGPAGRSRTVEDEQGRFAMEDLTPGKYVLSASADDRPPARSGTLEVESGRGVTGVRIVLAKGAKLTGIVTDAQTRKPIAGARVALDSVSSSGVSGVSATTDESGAYGLDGVPPDGPFSIRVEKEGYRTRIVSAISARGSGAASSNVELQPKKEGEGGDTELGGIGAVLGPPPSSLGAVVLALTPDGPAAKAGMQRQDWITRIDGQSTESMTLPECIQKLRGEPGTRVSVSVLRGQQELRFELVRAVVVR